jgi:hypothetical protein
MLAVLTIACDSNGGAPDTDGMSGRGGSVNLAGGAGTAGRGDPAGGAPNTAGSGGVAAGRAGSESAGRTSSSGGSSGAAAAAAGGAGAGLAPSVGGSDVGGSGVGGSGTGLGGSSGAGGSAGSSASSGLPWLRVEGNAIKNPDGDTVILRGVALMDLGATEEWYGGAKAMIDRLTDREDPQGDSPGWYPTVLRLAIYPTDGEVESPFTFQPGSDDFYEELLRPTVDYARQKGVYVILDWHYIDDTDSHVASTTAFWSYMAPKFADDSNVLFELYNEPINDGDWQVVRGHMQTWYDTVRESAPQNLVLVGTPNWSANIGPSATDPVDGTNIAYVAHMYPYHFGEADLRNQLAEAAAVHPVFVTEWGFIGGTDDILDGTVDSYGEPFKTFLTQHGVSWTAWCASYDWYPPMFEEDFTLRVGEDAMGGFVKDWLYETRDANRP